MKLRHILPAVASAGLLIMGTAAQAAETIKIGSFLAVTGRKQV